VKVLITGGAGFIGRRLVTALLARGTLPDAQGREQPIERLRVSDVAAPATPISEDARIETVIGDFSEPGAAERLVGDDTGAVFHLAAIVSGQAEEDFDLGMRINLDGTRRLLDACRALPSPARVVFTSSVAVFGGDMPEVLDDRTHLTPQTSYGSQKAACELLINDFSRKNFLRASPTPPRRRSRARSSASRFKGATTCVRSRRTPACGSSRRAGWWTRWCTRRCSTLRPSAAIAA
jgi:nucleoside-diphosphate-sugar epimerase